MQLITPTLIYNDINLMQNAVNTIVQEATWGNLNQIGLNYRINAVNKWTDATGNFYQSDSPCFGAKESDFTQLNNIPQYLKESILNLKLKLNINLGRIRIMKLLPRRGLSVHADLEIRYHFVIETNTKSFFCFNTNNDEYLGIKANCYHLPMDGQWYKVDTTKTHWVYNGGDSPRIHLVVCAI